MGVREGIVAALGALPAPVLAAGARAVFAPSWRRFVDATARPREVQLAKLAVLAARARDTAFGREHGFADLRTHADWQRRVPIRTYDGFEPYVARMLAGEQNVLIPDSPFLFARSSGTTGTPKSIPVTDVYLAEYRRPRRVWARQLMQAFPSLLGGRILSVHSPKLDGYTPAGVPCASITVAMSGSPELPGRPPSRWTLDPAPRALFLADAFALRYYFALLLALGQDVRLAAAVNPSTLVLLFDHLATHAEALAADLERGGSARLAALPPAIAAEVAPRLAPRPEVARRLRASLAAHGRPRPRDVWPNLRGFICWKGGSAPFYLAKLEALAPGLDAMDYGYLATEGGFSIPLSPNARGGVVSVAGHLLEFVPEDAGPEAEAVLADALEVGRRYRVIVSGSHGLYRYDIQDVVECVGHFQATAEIAFVHKAGNMLSITGEKVGERHVVLAMEVVREARLGLGIVGFSVAIELTETPRYVLAVEPDTALAPPVAARLAWAFDRALGEVNMEYAAKRLSGRLGAPRVFALEAGAYARHRAARVAAGAPDNHVKPPHLFRALSGLEDLGVVARFEPPVEGDPP